MLYYGRAASRGYRASRQVRGADRRRTLGREPARLGQSVYIRDPDRRNSLIEISNY